MPRHHGGERDLFGPNALISLAGPNPKKGGDAAALRFMRREGVMACTTLPVRDQAGHAVRPSLAEWHASDCGYGKPPEPDAPWATVAHWCHAFATMTYGPIAEATQDCVPLTPRAGDW